MKICLIYFWLWWLLAKGRLSPVITGGLCTGWFLLLGSPASRAWGLIRLWLMGSSQTRDWTDVPCISRQMILTHWITREVLQLTPYLTPLYSGLEALPQGKPSRTALCPSPQGNWNASAPSLPSWEAPTQLQGHSLQPGHRTSVSSPWQEARAAFFTLNCVQQVLLFSARAAAFASRTGHVAQQQGNLGSWGEFSPRHTTCRPMWAQGQSASSLGHRGRSHTHSLPSPLLRNDVRCVSSTESHFLNFSFKQEITEAAYTLGSKK